jgi:hypothetical protein
MLEIAVNDVLEMAEHQLGHRKPPYSNRHTPVVGENNPTSLPP